jgi:hypothetical protein
MKLQQQPFAQSGLAIDMDGGKVTWGHTKTRGTSSSSKVIQKSAVDSATPIVLHYSLWETAISLEMSPRLIEIGSNPLTDVLFIEQPAIVTLGVPL